jgi:hypothetical protein
MKKFKNQVEMFKYIWETRPHVSELSGETLYEYGHWLWHWQFLHILSKGSYPSYKLNPDNILLALPGEHERQEQYQVFKDKQTALKLKYNSDPNIKH